MRNNSVIILMPTSAGLRNRRGFLGPIGDDLPALIPLLFALLMFFSTFTHTFNVFETRGRAFAGDVAVLKVASILKANGYVETTDAFNKRCLNTGAAGINFAAVVTNAATAKEDFTAKQGLNDDSDCTSDCYHGIDVYNLKPYSISDAPLECKSSPDAKIPAAYGRNVVVKLFPIAVEEDKVVRPMHLVVVAWK